MIPEAYKQFIQEIILRTNNNEVLWEATDDKSYVLRTSDSTIEVGGYNDHMEEVNYYYFKFFNIKKKTEAGFRVNNLEDDYSTMESLFYVAVASAANIKDELKSFLGSL
jgi:hypothetical protein